MQLALKPHIRHLSVNMLRPYHVRSLRVLGGEVHELWNFGGADRRPHALSNAFRMSSGELWLKRVFHVAASVGPKLRVWGGNDYSSSYRVRTTTVESFDVSSESWLRPQLLDGSLPDQFQGMAITEVDETAYTFGGEAWTGSDYVYFNKIFKINLSTLQCREIVPEPHSPVPLKVSFSSVVQFDHMLVVHGGMCQWRKVVTDKVHVFDLQTSECVESLITPTWRHCL